MDGRRGGDQGGGRYMGRKGEGREAALLVTTEKCNAGVALGALAPYPGCSVSHKCSII